ncbi:MAG: type 1 glutamine amidotransferase [Candidatus Omnitrophica bacterium]|nr:type 1 glutamine amidotransferase [Candidatus Omnitrophota bacterium]
MILFLKHINIEGPGLLKTFFEDEGLETKTLEVDKFSAMSEDFSGIDAVVILGGPMNVYEEEKYPFLIWEDKFVRQLAEKRIFCLGICLGSQLLAKTLGAKVTKAETKEIGFYDVSLTQDGLENPLFDRLGRSLKVFQWHEDIFDIPKGGKLLASSKECTNQAFYFEPNIYGLQFHVEIDRPMIESWIKAYWGIIDISKDKKAQEILEGYDKIRTLLSSQARIICKNFISIIKEK